jgi:hypothetical protein
MTTTNSIPLAIPSHPRYYNGRFLTEVDFKDEHDYHHSGVQLINRMFRAGVVAIDGEESSLAVEASGSKKSEIQVKRGVALDHAGRQLVVPTDRALDLSKWRDRTILIVISYAEQAEENASYEPRTEKTKWLEEPAITALPESEGLQVGMLVLARITMNEKGEILGTPEDRRQFVRLHRSTDSGWVRLPFLPKPFSGGEKKNDFELLGTRAKSSNKGADGCLEIPVPAGADEIKQLRISGRSASPVRIWLECVSANMTANLIGDWAIQSMAGPEVFPVDHQLNEDDALALIVQADGEAEIFFVAVEFD